MGLFDFLKRGDKADEKKPGGKLGSWGKTASDKRAQSYERDEALRGLMQIGTPEAAEALLKRFTVKIDPSITDEEEKQLAFEGIVGIGRGERAVSLAESEAANQGRLDAKARAGRTLSAEEVTALCDVVVERTVAFCQRAESLTWPIKVLRELLDDEPYLDHLLALLAEFDTEYTRNVDPKINLIHGLSEVREERARAAIEPYLHDANEGVRFHAVQALCDLGDPRSIAALVAQVLGEESVRVKNKVAEGFVTAGWQVPEALREAFRAAMREAYEYRVTPDGKVQKA